MLSSSPALQRNQLSFLIHDYQYLVVVVKINNLASPQYPGRLHCLFPGCLPPHVPGDGLPGSEVPETAGDSEDGGDSLQQPGEVNLHCEPTDQSRQQKMLTF